jgi:hypothetical protein
MQMFRKFDHFRFDTKADRKSGSEERYPILTAARKILITCQT